MSNSSSIWLAESRQPIINAVLAALDELTLSKKPGLLTLWGGRGVGKTLLLNSIEERIKTSKPHIATQRWDLKQHTLEDVRARVSNCINAASADRPQAVLLDNFDLLLRNDPDGSDFFDIERDVILPSVENGSCFFIITSQIELTQWREDEVRQHQLSFQIPSLVRQEMNTLIQESGLREPKSAFELTYGHPKAVEWLSAEPTLSKETISAKAFEYFLEGLSPDSRELAGQVCPMPLFNPFLLRLISHEGDVISGILYLKHLDQIREMIGVGLVYWDISFGAYRFRDNAVRRLLARGMRLRDPLIFQHVNKTANQYYQTEVRSASYLHRHLVSAVYHRAIAIQEQGNNDAGENCLSWVCENLANWIGAQWSDVLEMWVSGDNDFAFAEEMKDLIGPEVFGKISDCLQTAQQSNP